MPRWNDEQVRALLSTSTPGPWKAGRPDMATIVDGVDSKWIYAGSTGPMRQYCAIASGPIDGDWDEVMGNAHLIAAAPDLAADLLEARERVQALEQAMGSGADALEYALSYMGDVHQEDERAALNTMRALALGTNGADPRQAPSQRQASAPLALTAEDRESLKAIAHVLGPKNTKHNTRITANRAPDDTLSLAEMREPDPSRGRLWPELEGLVSFTVSDLLLVHRVLTSVLNGGDHAEG